MMSKGSLNRKIPNIKEMDGAMYSHKPSVINGSLLAAKENRPIGIAVASPANISRKNLKPPAVAMAPPPLFSIITTTTKAMGAKNRVS